MIPPDPEAALARLQAYVRPDGGTRPVVDNWQPPAFGSYDELKAWLKESVLTARVYTAFPDGRWTLDLMLKEQVPGTTYRIRL
jgi:hypothetical protein